MPVRHEFTLDNGNKFYIRRYDAFLAMRIFGDVQRKILGPLAMFLEAQDKDLAQDVRDKNLQDAVEKISASLDGNSLVDLVKKVLNPEYISVSVDNEPAVRLEENMLNRSVDTMFDTVALVFEVLRYNYEDLFTRGRSLIGNITVPQSLEAIR